MDILVGEPAAVVRFAGAIDRRLDDQVARTAHSSPAVSQAMAELDRTRAARIALDHAVRQAEGRRDDALVVARCEFNPRRPARRPISPGARTRRIGRRTISWPTRSVSSTPPKPGVTARHPCWTPRSPIASG